VTAERIALVVAILLLIGRPLVRAWLRIRREERQRRSWAELAKHEAAVRAQYARCVQLAACFRAVESPEDEPTGVQCRNCLMDVRGCVCGAGPVPAGRQGRA
jgi:hypothetical protein